MCMMHIGHMRMSMPDPSMTVFVRVGLSRRIGQIMFVLMVFIMHMRVGMGQRFVLMFVLVPFGEV